MMFRRCNACVDVLYRVCPVWILKVVEGCARGGGPPLIQKPSAPAPTGPNTIDHGAFIAFHIGVVDANAP